MKIHTVKKVTIYVCMLKESVEHIIGNAYAMNNHDLFLFTSDMSRHGFITIQKKEIEVDILGDFDLTKLLIGFTASRAIMDTNTNEDLV